MKAGGEEEDHHPHLLSLPWATDGSKPSAHTLEDDDEDDDNGPLFEQVRGGGGGTMRLGVWTGGGGWLMLTVGVMLCCLVALRSWACCRPVGPGRRASTPRPRLLLPPPPC